MKEIKGIFNKLKTKIDDYILKIMIATDDENIKLRRDNIKLVAINEDLLNRIEKANYDKRKMYAKNKKLEHLMDQFEVRMKKWFIYKSILLWYTFFMNKNILILADTRQKSDSHITNYFDKNKIEWQRATLSNCGDYMAIKYDNIKGIYKDYSILIDTKKDLLELAGNLCKTSEHERIKKEISHAKELGCNKFIFLITDSKIKTSDDIKKWSNIHSQVKGETLFKIMKTMKERYDIHYIFTDKKHAGEKIYTILTS